MSRYLHELSLGERCQLGLHALLNAGSLAAVSRESQLSITDLQKLREEFIEAARVGLAERYGAPAAAAPDEHTRTLLRQEVAPLLFELGALFAEVRSEDRAETCFQRAIEFAPVDGTYKKGYALHLYQRRRLMEARAVALEALELLHGDAECCVTVATAHWAEGDLDKAKSYLLHATQQHPLPDYILATVTELCLAVGEEQLALSVAERELGARQADGAMPALYNVATVKRRMGQYAEAAALLTDGLTRWPDAPALVLLLAAIECSNLGAAEEGIDRLVVLAEQHPDDATVLTALSDMLRASGRWSEATECARGAALCDPHYQPALRSLLDCYRVRGELDELQKLARRMLVDDPTNVPVRLCLLQALIDAGDVAALEPELETIRSQSPNAMAIELLDVFVLHETADAKRMDVVEERLRTLLPNPPTWGNHVDLVVTLCRYLRLNGAAGRAARILDALPVADRSQVPVMLELAMALAESGEADKARGLLEAAWTSEPHDALHGARLAAHMVEFHGDRTTAIEVLRTTRRQASWNDQCTLGFAMATVKVGDKAAALQLVYDYFIDERRLVPSLSYLHTVIGDAATDTELSREQRFAANAILVAGLRSPKQVAGCMAALRELATTSEERDVLVKLELEIGVTPA